MWFGCKTKLLGLLLGFALGTTVGCAKDDQQHMLFEVAGKTNTVYLLGSIHMLRRQDHPLPEVMHTAYTDAEVLVMELDMDDLDPAALAGLFGQAAQAENGETLESLLGSDYSEAEQLASNIEANLTVFNKFEPWFVALTIANLELMKLGYYDHHGVESYFTKLADQDGKEIYGLETPEFQLSLFDELPIDEQRHLFIETLRQAAGIEQDMSTMVETWRAGDGDRLHDMLFESMLTMGSLYDALVVKRNQNWISRIEDYLAQEDDFLVIVGAGHLSGEQGVVELLKGRGFKITQH